MGSKWGKVKLALGLNLCTYIPRPLDSDDDEKDSSSSVSESERNSGASRISTATTDGNLAPPSTVSHGSKLSKSFSRSSKRTCSICLASLKRGDGNAIFTAECSHSFHFQCIASNVKHGNHICPVCRAKWKEIPLHYPSLDPPLGRARVNPVDWPQNNALTAVTPYRHSSPLFQAPEPAIFNDDEPVDDSIGKSPSIDGCDNRAIKVETFPEVPAVPRSNSRDNFSVLVHLKAPGSVSVSVQDPCRNQTNLLQVSRAPVDLVTVIDISGSMAGTKLALLKRAMSFVIQNLGPSDRLAVIAFSSTARRLFPLRRMSETGRQQALQAVNSLVANGGTNIAEGLRKGAKIMEDRREKNPVASIILLSDGQDTYTVNNQQQQPNYQLLLPLSIHSGESKIPVHAFGFGVDHDPSSMHSISEISGGTFSFIETQGIILDAFAQCIGGLLSVVVKGLQVSIECLQTGICLGSLKAGSYPNRLMSDRRTGSIDVGDLYADEERDFLLSINIPSESLSSETSLLKVKCVYTDPLTKQMVTLRSEVVKIKRPEKSGEERVSVEVERQQKRFEAAEAMAQARAAAEKGDLVGASSILENCRKLLSADRLCIALDAELKEMQERMTSRHVYEASGRAYILSGLSSHSWQRATARGDSIDGSSLIQAYQTPSMVEMLTRSQATLLGTPSAHRPVWSLKPR